MRIKTKMRPNMKIKTKMKIKDEDEDESEDQKTKMGMKIKIEIETKEGKNYKREEDESKGKVSCWRMRKSIESNNSQEEIHGAAVACPTRMVLSGASTGRDRALLAARLLSAARGKKIWQT